ncbi:hypothetical protein [Actinomycetospora chibensis]|uniref:Uncharacterized protein n=1 Tax=Actinomycetospora chibensis TaxID=663606 RepID=A0ABV9RJQ4_9PSEU|nr:hypothetical protein [Actinomycetospora chibensis]MDD7924600.1 hypothetical protein [Actinomycetospora chibensis]
MDLRRALLRAAAARPHVLIIGGLGTDRLRARVEQEVARRGWPVASAPADADVVVVIGRPGPELRAVIDGVWTGVPAPRSQIWITDEDEVSSALDDSVQELADLAAQRAHAPRSGLPAIHTGVFPPEQGHDISEQSGHDEPGEHGHHHHDGGMELPGGLAMADLGEDRDGLALDQLHVPLGPVLPEWPSGLVVDIVLQGDVIQEARSRFLDDVAAVERQPDAARALDSAARVLALSGWEGPAARARGLRDVLLFGGGETVRILEELDDLRRRVRRSRLLRWVLRSAGAGRSEVLEALDDKLLSARAAVAGAGAEAPVATDLPSLDARLVGVEFAAARLIVAVADPLPQPALARPTDQGGAS